MHSLRGLVLAASIVAALLTATSGALAAASSKQSGPSGPQALDASDYALSAPVGDLAATERPSSDGAAPPRINPLADEPDRGRRGTDRGRAPSDPLLDDARHRTSRTPAPNLVFSGVQNPFACGGCSPPDTIGDVGPNHYVQMVNATKVAIFSKSGTLLTPAFDLGDLWPAASPCNDNFGDPVVLYDPLADRWLLSQFHGGPNALCFAISQTPNPLGAYHLFQFNTPQFPDYFKVGVWPTGYYVSSNENTYTAYAFNRAKMLAGDPTAEGVRFPGETNFLLPADVDGPNAPAPQGGLFYTFKDNAFHGGADRLELFRLTPNFATPASSTFVELPSIPVAPYTYTVCGFFVFNCIPQRGTAQRVDAVSEWPMWRFVYRRLADREVLLGNFTIDVGSDRAGIRWFELRNTGSGYHLFQEGTHAPGDQHSFMGSIAMDGAGNIALGYSASSSSLFPAIRYATRCATDPPGTLQAEQTLRAGNGSQTASNRWGDYSAMSIDPATDSNFWYTNEYYNPSSGSNWKTAIGTFDSPASSDCVAPAPQPRPPPPPPVEPSNELTIEKVKRNKRKGTARIKVEVPGPGELELSGKGIKRQRPVSGGGRTDAALKPVAGAGTVKLKVKAKGKKKRKLNRKGKVKVRAKIVYTPDGGTSATKTKRITLKKKLKDPKV
jgi:hypothetical protein